MEEEVKNGDYVIASRWSDEHPFDPWRVGFVKDIIKNHRNETCYIVGEEDDSFIDKRLYPHARKITKKEGDQIILSYKMNTEL